MNIDLSSKLSLAYRIIVNHQQSVHHSLSTLLVREQEIPWQHSKQFNKLFFQMISQVYSVPVQTEVRRKTFLGWTSIDLSPKPSLTCGVNVNYCKKCSSPYSYSWEQGTPQQFSKQISKLSFQLSVQVDSVLGLKGRERPFLEVARRLSHCEITPKSTWLS